MPNVDKAFETLAQKLMTRVAVFLNKLAAPLHMIDLRRHGVFRDLLKLSPFRPATVAIDAP